MNSALAEWLQLLTLESEKIVLAKLNRTKVLTQVETNKLQLLVVRDYYRRNLFALCMDVLDYGFLSLAPDGTQAQHFNERYHKPLCDLLQRASESNVQVTLPRDHFKSTTGRASDISFMLNCPEEGLLLLTSDDEKAANMVKPIVEVFTNNQKFRGLFPDYCPNGNQTPRKLGWTQHQFSLPKRQRPSETPSYMAKGVGTSLSGYHFGRIRCDDLVDHKNITDETKETAVLRFRNIWPMLLAGRHIIYIGTRYADYDLHGMIRAGEFGADWLFSEDFGLPLTATEDGVIGGRPLLPERFSVAVLKQRYESMGPYQYSAQFNNDPVLPENARVQRDWFFQNEPFTARMTEEGVYVNGVRKFMRIFMAIDCAFTTETANDQVAMIVGGQDEEGHWWLLDRYLGRPGIEALGPQIESLARTWGVRQVGLETGGMQGLLLKSVREYLMRNGISVREFNPQSRGFSKVRKEDRIISTITPAACSGRLHLAEGLFDELVHECVRLPHGRRDDFADAFAYLLWFDTRVEPPKSEEILGVIGAHKRVACQRAEQKVARRMNISPLGIQC